LIISPRDDPQRIVDAMLATGYDQEFCVSLNFDPPFIARLMEAGFLVMSTRLGDPDDEEDEVPEDSPCIVLPKLHLVRSALFFKNLHIKKSIKPFLKKYELRPDSDFNVILDRCVQVHGDDWLTPPLVQAIREIRLKAEADPAAKADPAAFPDFSGAAYPVSFGVYRNGKLAAGEFGIITGKVYTSYSGYYDEANAGTVQIILLTRWLEEQGFAFFDLGMPLDYKSDLGAVDISPEEFIRLFRQGKEF
jgi:Leu/Phe-tRNA-protein transferase